MRIIIKINLKQSSKFREEAMSNIVDKSIIKKRKNKLCYKPIEYLYKEYDI